MRTHVYTQHSKESPSRAKSCSALVTKCVYLTPHVQPESASVSMQPQKPANRCNSIRSPAWWTSMTAHREGGRRMHVRRTCIWTELLKLGLPGCTMRELYSLPIRKRRPSVA